MSSIADSTASVSGNAITDAISDAFGDLGLKRTNSYINY